MNYSYKEVQAASTAFFYCEQFQNLANLEGPYKSYNPSGWILRVPVENQKESLKNFSFIISLHLWQAILTQSRSANR